MSSNFIPPERQAAAEAATAHAERDLDGWYVDAMHAFMARARTCAVAFTIGDVRHRIEGLDDPPDNRAWGTVAQGMVRCGYLRKTGAFRNDEFGSPKPLYEVVR